MKKMILIIPATLLMISCTNYQIVERCKQTDWHRLGVMTGMMGQVKPTEEDNRNFQMCNQEGEKPNFLAYDNGLKEGIKRFCTTGAAEKRGSLGLDYNLDLCSPQLASELLSFYNKGVKNFCLSSGYKVGASGKPLAVVCPQETLNVFNPEFQRGRTDFLVNSVEKLNSQISSMTEKISKLEESNSNLDLRNRALESKNRNLERELEDAKRKISR